MSNKIITLENGTVIGEYKAETLIDLYYEHKIHNTEDFIMDAVFRGYEKSEFFNLDRFNNEHNTLETYTEAVMDTAKRCDCIEQAEKHLEDFN